MLLYNKKVTIEKTTQYQHYPFPTIAGTIICSSIAVSRSSCADSLRDVGCDFSEANTARSLSSTFLVLFVFFPPQTIKTADNMPHEKLRGIRPPIVQAGR